MNFENESLSERKKRTAKILKILYETYPDATCTLEAVSPWELLVGAILAAQCTDERVNKITPELFATYPTIEAMSQAPVEKIEELIRSCGIYRNKAKAIRGSAQMIIKDYNGKVPQTRGELLKLPGVGRKIANLVLGDAFGQEAVVVDTHCGRISRLLGLSKEKNPVKVERDLEKILPQDAYTDWGHLLVNHGRELCRARCRQCIDCPLQQLCAYGIEVDTKGKAAGDCV